MITLAQILEFIRSISFGALAVNSVLLLTFIYYPHIFPSGFTYKEVLYIGTVIGTVLHRTLNALIFNPATKSIARSFTFYTKLLELHLLHSRRVLNAEQYVRISDLLKADYFGISNEAWVKSNNDSPNKKNLEAHLRPQVEEEIKALGSNTSPTEHKIVQSETRLGERKKPPSRTKRTKKSNIPENTEI